MCSTAELYSRSTKLIHTLVCLSEGALDLQEPRRCFLSFCTSSVSLWWHDERDGGWARVKTGPGSNMAQWPKAQSIMIHLSGWRRISCHCLWKHWQLTSLISLCRFQNVLTCVCVVLPRLPQTRRAWLTSTTCWKSPTRRWRSFTKSCKSSTLTSWSKTLKNCSVTWAALVEH